MTKKTLIILIILILGIIFDCAGIIYLLTVKNNNNPDPSATQPASSYSLSLDEYNKNVTAQLTSDGKTINLNGISQIDQYGLVSFNSAGDILWFQCGQGYKITNFQSLTGNNSSEVISQVYIVIQPGQHNNLTVTCARE